MQSIGTCRSLTSVVQAVAVRLSHRMALIFLDLHIKINHDRQVVRKGHRRNPKILHFDLFAVENKIEMSLRLMTQTRFL